MIMSREKINQKKIIIALIYFKENFFASKLFILENF